MGLVRTYVWYVASVLGSLAVAVVVGLALSWGGIGSEVSETILIVVFFTCLTGSVTLYWYRNTYIPAQTGTDS